MIGRLGIKFILLITISQTFSLDFKLDPRFENDWTGVCAEGRLQSPIAIPNICDRKFLSYINIEYTNLRVPIKDVKVTNSARQTVFEWDRSVERSVVIKTTSDVSPFRPNTPYILQNFHVHHSMNNQSGTMHSIGGSFYASEMHFLFVRKEFDNNASAGFVALGNTLEIVVLYKLSNVRNRAWTALNDLMLSKKLSESEKITSDLSINLLDLLPKSSTFTLYHGSLPASGCLEVVTWIVYDTVMEYDIQELGMRQWTYISDGKEVPLKRNVRRIQSRNGRPVYQGRSWRISHHEAKAPTESNDGHGYY